jgi:uncharacterized protein YbjT (DUF2867 family)
VLREDLAPAIAAVLVEDGHEGKVYDLTGHDAVMWEQLAELASEHAGRPIPYRSIDDTEAAARMQAAGLPARPGPRRIASRLGVAGRPASCSMWPDGVPDQPARGKAR